MGYSTEFNGEFKINKPLDAATYKLLKGLNETRRMARKVDKKYGVEGEFYIKGKGSMGQDHEPNIIDFNKQPITQPSLWCQWVPSTDKERIVWDCGEKFYRYTEWIIYLIDKILKPRGYILNGNVDWQGEDSDDRGTICITNNVVKEHIGFFTTMAQDDFFKRKQVVLEKISKLEGIDAEQILGFLENVLDNNLKEVIIDGITNDINQAGS